MRESGVDFNSMRAVADKFTRALPVAAAWNSGKFKIPAQAQWLNDFLNEVCAFSGKGDAHDDVVDAFAAAFDNLGPPPATYRPQIHTRTVGDDAWIGLG